MLGRRSDFLFSSLPVPQVGYSGINVTGGGGGGGLTYFLGLKFSTAVFFGLKI